MDQLTDINPEVIVGNHWPIKLSSLSHWVLKECSFVAEIDFKRDYLDARGHFILRFGAIDDKPLGESPPPP